LALTRIGRAGTGRKKNPDFESQIGAILAMLDAFNRALDLGAQGLTWIPANAIGFALIAVAILIAFTLHNTVVRFLRRRLGARFPYAASLLGTARRVTRFALMLFAASAVLPFAPLDQDATAIVGKSLLLGTTVLIGWVALVAADLTADLYLLRFRVDTEDNLLARKHVTQVRILKRAVETLVIVIATGFALMTFDSVRQYGVSLFASAGVAGLVAGLAARPLLSSLIAGVQIAMTQPIRIDDAVVVEGEWGWVEEITSTYVVIKLWDWRRLIVPLSYFIEKPFQNWTREGAAIIGSVLLYVDYSVPVERVREKLTEIVKASKLWDGRVVNLQVSDAKDHVIELRALVSARTSPIVWDLRCEVREKLIAFLRENYPHALPRQRADIALHGFDPGMQTARGSQTAGSIRSPQLAPAESGP
jgi:small-conductance mechanosensitive channel